MPVTGVRQARRPSQQYRVVASVLVLIAVITAVSQVALARKRWKPPTRDEVAQVWIGWSSDQLYLLRLELFPDGKGLGGYIFLGEEPRVFEISGWRYQEGRIEIYPVAPQGAPSWVRFLKGGIVGVAMNLAASGADWKLSFSLRRESELEDKQTKLKRNMER